MKSQLKVECHDKIYEKDKKSALKYQVWNYITVSKTDI